MPVQESLPLEPGQDVARGVLSVSIAWVEGHGAGRGPQGQGWGGTEAGREFQLAPSLPSNRPGSAEGLGLEEQPGFRLWGGRTVETVKGEGSG